MNQLITSSEALWNSIIQDLLLLSPNITVSRCSGTASASYLQSLAVRYWRVASTLCSPRELEISDIRPIPCHETILDSNVVPGMPLLVMVKAITASLHLVSTETGSFVSSWELPEGGLSDDTRIYITSSNIGGLGPLVVMSTWSEHVG
jgi:hypothetical protein